MVGASHDMVYVVVKENQNMHGDIDSDDVGADGGEKLIAIYWRKLIFYQGRVHSQ